jgi:hypothetical protein
MKRFSLLLCVFVLVLWSFGIAGHATNNLNKMPATLFGQDTELNRVWIRVLDIEKFERTTWIEDWKKKGDLFKQDSLLRTWQHVLDTANPKVGFDPTDSYFKPSFRPGFHNQNTVAFLSAETVSISDSGILLIFTIGLVLVCASKFGEKLFKKSKR